MSQVRRDASFEALIRPGEPLPCARALALLRSAAAALDAFQARHGAHGAIGPGAFLLKVEGAVTLCSPGEASAAPGHATRRRYLSPQRLAGEAARPADDLFALGILAVELLVGRPGPGADNASSAGLSGLLAHLDQSELAPDVRRVLRSQVATAPGYRFASGAAFVGELERAYAGQPFGDGLHQAGGAGGNLGHRAASDAAWNRRFGPRGRLRVAPDADLVLAELPDGDGPLSRPPRRRISRRTDYPDLALPGVLVLAIVTVLCSVYLFPLYYMLARHL